MTKHTWTLTITKENNGYIVTIPPDSDETVSRIVLFEEKTDNDLQTMSRLLDFVKEYFAIFNSKHDKENLYIEIK